MKFSPLGVPRLGKSGRQKLSLISSWNRQFYCGMRLFYPKRPKILRSLKMQDQSWILAQNFFVAWKSFGWNFFKSLYSELRSIDCQVPRELMSRARCIINTRVASVSERKI